MIVSVIIALCSEICFFVEGQVIDIVISIRTMHCESSILSSIIHYFDNKEESHSIKIQNLIEEYETNLQNSSSSNISLNIVDTFIALICL